MLQTFPEKYRFVTEEMEAVCRLVGNAVPPLYAKRVGHSVMTALRRRAGSQLARISHKWGQASASRKSLGWS